MKSTTTCLSLSIFFILGSFPIQGGVKFGHFTRFFKDCSPPNSKIAYLSIDETNNSEVLKNSTFNLSKKSKNKTDLTQSTSSGLRLQSYIVSNLRSNKLDNNAIASNKLLGLLPPCNLKSPWVNGYYDNLSATIVDDVPSAIPLCLGEVNSIGNLIDSDLNNSTSVTITGTNCDAILSVKDNDGTDDFPAGSWAGFNISTNDLLSGGSLGASVIIRTYLNGSPRDLYDAGQWLSELSSGINLGARADVGFITTQTFDEIRIEYSALVSALFTAEIYYPIVINFCAGVTPSCNVPTPLIRENYPVTIDNLRTTGITIGGFYDTDNIINSDLSDSTLLEMPLGMAATAEISVKDNKTIYPAGYFVGFEIANYDITGVNLMQYIEIKTYENNTLKETVSNPALTLSTIVNLGGSRNVIGFVTTQSFNEIELVVNQPLSFSLGYTYIFNAIITNFCAGSDLGCNNFTTLTNPNFPVIINSTETGIVGDPCVGCSVSNASNIINLYTEDYGTINILAGVSTIGQVSISNPIEVYSDTYWVGFDIQNPLLTDLSLLDGITITTYLNGAAQMSKSGIANLLNIQPSGSLDPQRRTIGFVSNLPFDEIKIEIGNFGVQNAGETKIYGLMIKKYCSSGIACNETYYLKEPEFTVVIDDFLTGITSGICAYCSVSDVNNVISSENDDFATIILPVGSEATGSIAVQDALIDYPAGSTVGFVIEDLNNLNQADLFNAIKITTYLDGVKQESEIGIDLSNSDLLSGIIAPGPGIYNISFNTAVPFDEVQISISSLVNKLVNIRVYSAFVDTRSTTDLTFNCCPITAPQISEYGRRNDCPNSNKNLNNLIIGNTPANSTVVWFDGPNPLTDNTVPDPSDVSTSGPYYAFFHNQTVPNDCYSPASEPVIITYSPCTTVSITGNVFHDTNGNEIDASSSGINPIPENLNATLMNAATRSPVSVTTVNPDGAFQFNDIFPGNYFVAISLDAPIRTSNMPEIVLPEGWVFTGDFNGIPGTNNSYITPGISEIFEILGSSIDNINFGLEQSPVAVSTNVNTPFDASGNTFFTMASTSFDGNDFDNGMVEHIVLSQFPTNINEIAINEVNFTAETWPLSGISLPTDVNGNPTVSIAIDPISSDSTTVFVYRTIDNAAMSSPEATVNQTFADALPLNIVSFEGKYMDCGITLNWTTTNLSQVKYYEIQRSESNKNFVTIGKLSPSLNNKYEFRDQLLSNKMYYYRILQTDADGSKYYSQIIALENNCNVKQLYPTYTKGVIKITGASSEDKGFIYNEFGQMVKSFDLDKNIIDISNLASGTYFINILTKSNVPFTEKIIKH